MKFPFKKNKPEKNEDRTKKEATLAGAKILITGGTGTFGRAFLDKCIAEGAKEIRIFSRDEKKQYDMAQLYKKHENVKFVLGDVRDKRTVDNAMYGIDFVFHAAAMKQVPSSEAFPMEAIKTNVIGSDNVLSSAIQKHVKKVVCLSTDKAVYPTSAMGMTKAYMEKLAYQRAAEKHRTEVCVTRFGNLVASRGSAVPLFLEQVQHGLPITITDPNMTRYMMTVEEAVDLVAEAFKIGCNGDLLVKPASACTTGGLASAVGAYLNLPGDYPIHYIGRRPGEKMHEALLTEEEAETAVMNNGYIVVHHNDGVLTQPQAEPIDVAYKSELAPLMSEEEILALIESVFSGGVK